ncbi:CHAT domain-containing protein [Aerosakkonema funiforme]|uniref:nSTAND1 domain-containing NTPase n=1 Tax=Aerosakkonema funiforme TaxID=1246630 RepID=UPI0035B8C81A
MNKSLKFEITIQRKHEDYWPVVVTFKGRDGLRKHAEGDLRLTSDQFEKLIKFRSQKYGEELGKALFNGNVYELFLESFEQDSSTTFRLLLSITAEDPEIKTLHWEWLCVKIKGTWKFLSLSNQIFFSQYIPTRKGEYPLIDRNNLRALIVVACPYPEGDKEFFNVENTISELKEVFKDINIDCDVLANVKGAIGSPTLNELITTLNNASQKPYTLLHIVCHAFYMKDESPPDTILHWATKDNKIETVEGKNLIDRLNHLNCNLIPHLTFLCACDSAMPAAPKNDDGIAEFSGLAQKLVRELGMPAVVGMTREVQRDTAIKLANKFYQHLGEHGEVDKALRQAMIELANEDDIDVPALFSRLGGRPLFSNTVEKAELSAKEIQDGIDTLRKLLKNLAPNAKILWKTFEDQVETLKKIEGKESDDALIEKKQALAKLNYICDQVLEDISFYDLPTLEERTQEYNPVCPFPGLISFGDEKYHKFFFGRDYLVKELQIKLKKSNNFLAVIGPSGSGKSSIVLARLIPQLKKENQNLRMVYLTPTNKPLEQLDKQIQELEASSDVVLVVDQFEELFTLCNNKNEQKKFIKKLLERTNHHQVIITMRADFLGECIYYRDLKERIEKNQKLIGPMERDELGKAIEMQAKEADVKFEIGLSNAILAEVEKEPGAMPLLQHALRELWNRRRGRWLCHEEYDNIGRLHGAIAQTADNFYQNLSHKEKEGVKEIFLKLTWVGEAKYTRQRVNLDDLLTIGDEKFIRQLVSRLAGEEARLVVTDSLTELNTVEVAHEALFTHWPKLEEWLKENSINLQLNQSIEKAASEWKTSQKENDKQKEESFLVHHGARLKIAEELLQNNKFNFTKNSRDYIKACVQRRDRLNRKELEKDILTYTAEAQKLFVDNKRLDALAKMTEAGEKLQGETKISPEAEFSFLVIFGQMLAEVDELNSFKAHEEEIFGVAFSPDNQLIASASYDRTIKLWNRDGTLIQTLSGHEGHVMDVSFSPDGKILASASRDNTIKLWQKQEIPQAKSLQQSTKWECVETLQKHKAWIYAVSFSPKGNIIASGSIDGTLILWHCKDGVYLPTEVLEKHTDEVVDVAFSPNGKMVASASQDKTVKLWTLEGELLTTLKGHENTVTSVSFSADSRTLVSSSQDRTIRMWKIDGTELYIKDIQKPIEYVAFSPDGQKIASAIENGNIIIWQNYNDFFTEVRTLNGHKDKVKKVSFSSDSNTIVSCGRDTTVKLWHSCGKFEGHSDKIVSIDLSADGNIIATASHDGTVKLWERNGSLKKNLPIDSRTIIDIKFNPVKDIIATASHDGTLKLWSIEGELLKTFKNDDINELKNISFSPDGNLIAIASKDSTVKLWHPDKNTVKVLSQHKDSIHQVAFSPDGTMIASASNDGTVILWNLDGKLHKILSSHKYGVVLVSFSPTSKTIATVSIDGIKIWNFQGQLQKTFANNEKIDILCVHFLENNSMDSDILAVIRGTQIIEFWSLDGDLKQTIQPIHENSPVDIATFSSKWRTIMLVQNGRIKLWNFNLEELLDNSRNLLQDYLQLQQ